jgi:ABC-2 type transport system permease protein
MPSAEAREREKRIASLPMEVSGRSNRFLTGTLASVLGVWRRRELLGLLVRRDLRARYKGSTLGILWSLIKPLAQLLIFYFAIGQILGAARLIPSFAIFVFIGLTAWTLFTEIVTNGTSSIVGNGALIKKVSLPREIFPLASTGGALVNLGVQLIVLLGAMLAIGEFPVTAELLWIVPALLLIVVYGTALAILLAAANVYFRDFQHLVEVVLIVGFWASPIVYSFSFLSSLELGWLRELYLANPVTLGILGMQRALWVAGAGDPANWPPQLGLRILIAFLVSLVLLWLSQRVFARLQGNFAQEL